MTLSPDDPRSETFQFIEEIRREFPRFRVIKKRGDPLSHLIDVLLRVITLNGQREYITSYHTILANRLYVPDGWETINDESRVITLRHERVHLRQNRRYTPLGMAVIYTLPFFPLGLAYGRARIEWEAYAETIRATAEFRGFDAAASPHLRAHIVSQFTSAAYGWMWPFPAQIERWYDLVLAELRQGASSRP